MATTLSVSIVRNSQSVSANKSNISFYVYAHSTYGSYNNNNQAGGITVDGVYYGFNHGYSANTTTLLFSGSKDCYHDTNGNKNVSASASYITGTGSGTIYASASQDMPQINTTPSNIAIFTTNPNPIKDNENVTVGWSGATTPNYAIDYYHLYCRRYSNGAWSSYVKIGGNINTTSYLHDVKSTYSDIKAGERIQYKVFTHNTAGKFSSGIEASPILDVITSSTMSIKVSGNWKKGVAFVKVSGTYKKGIKCFTKVNGVWKANK